MSARYEVRVRPRTTFSVHRYHPSGNQEIADKLSFSAANNIARCVATALMLKTEVPVVLFGSHQSDDQRLLEGVTPEDMTGWLENLAGCPQGSNLVMSIVTVGGRPHLRVTHHRLKQEPI